MKLSRPETKSILISTLVLAISITTGILAGKCANFSGLHSSAASANITVTDNNQPISQDQSSSIQTITKTSTVTVKNSEASYGYTLTAQLAENTIQNSTVHIYSTSSTTCSSPGDCPLNTSTPTTILTTDNDTATTTNGDTTTWTIQISVPANTPLGNYIVDIAYEESTNTPPGPADLGAMQLLTNQNCPTDLAKAYDARNNQYYYVKKIPNSGGTGIDLCWMLSNLRYEGGGTNTYSDTKTLTELSGSQSSVYTPATYADPGGSTDYTHTDPIHNPPTTNSFYGYLYNWCAAMGGQTNACNSTSTSGFNTAVSVCPAGWRLPTGGASGEFQTLVTALGNPTTGTALNTSFLAVYSGGYANGLDNRGSGGYLWSSTVGSAAGAYYLSFYSGSVYPANNFNKLSGFAVRCVR